MTEEEKEHLRRLEAYVKLMEEQLNQKSLLSQMELETEEEKRQLGQRRMDEKLVRLAKEGGKKSPCPKCGALTRVRTKAVPRTFKSLSGTHTFTRNYHYCENCKEGFYPRDEELGLARDTEISNELAKRTCDFFLNDPFETAEERWPVHYPHLPLSANQFRGDAERLGKKLEAADEAVLESALKAPSTQKAEVLYVQNDGALLSMQTGEWKEVKSAVLFTKDKHLKGTEKKRGEILEARYVSVLGNQEEFKKVLEPALKVANAIAAAVVVWLADGAKGNWNLARRLCPRAIQILDWFHAVEHAVHVAKLLFGEDDPHVELFRHRVEELLLAGQVKECIKELQSCIELAPHGLALKALTELIGYYRSNQSRMRYDFYRANGWLIGSGVIESAHRHVIHARMKRAGQHWGELGGRRMARMRAAYRTAGPDRVFAAIHWAHRETLRNGRLPKPLKRRASNR